MFPPCLGYAAKNRCWRLINNALKTLIKATLCIKFLKNGSVGEMDGSVKAK